MGSAAFVRRASTRCGAATATITAAKPPTATADPLRPTDLARQGVAVVRRCRCEASLWLGSAQKVWGVCIPTPVVWQHQDITAVHKAARECCCNAEFLCVAC